MSSWLFLFFLVPACCLAEPDSPSPSRDLPQATLAGLREIFATQTPAYSRDLLDSLTARTRIPGPELRTRLLALLDTLEQQRERQTATWKTLAGLSGAELSPETADKLLGNLLHEARGILSGRRNFLLDNSLRQATRKARLYDYQGRDLLLKALDWGLTGSAAEVQDGEFGILVDGHTNRFELNRDPLFLFFDSADEAFVMEQVREIQRFIIPLLVRRLPEAKRVRWAMRQREYTALAEPRYKLVFGVDGLSFTGTNRDLRPCIEATIELLSWPDQTPVHTWNFQHCTEQYGSATTHELTPFYDEIAVKVLQLVDDYLGQ